MQRALVTGASRGVGRALVVALADRGLDVVATARHVADLDGLPAVAKLPLDVTSDDSVAAVAADAGPVDVLVNNAAVSVAAPVEDTPADAALAMFDVNVVGPLRLVAAFVPGMRERGGGTILNVSSVAGRAVFPLNGVHAASKHALEALSEALAVEAQTFGIRVLVVELGSVATGMYENQQRFFSAAYADLDHAQREAWTESQKHQADTGQVARSIVDALLSGESALRVPIGQDAGWVLAERARLDDDAWITRVSQQLRSA